MSVKRLFYLSFGIVIAGLLIYILAFRHFSVVANTAIWGDFAAYLGLFVSLSNLAVFIWLTVSVFNYNRSRESENDRFVRAIERPVVILKSIQSAGREIWIAYNIGNGPALNLRIAESRTAQIVWETPVKCYSLGKGDQLELTWLKHANAICITYEDVFKFKFATIGAGDESQVTSLDKDFRPIETPNKVFTKEDFYAFDKLSAIRIYQALAHATTSVSITTELTR